VSASANRERGCAITHKYVQMFGARLRLERSEPYAGKTASILGLMCVRQLIRKAFTSPRVLVIIYACPPVTERAWCLTRPGCIHGNPVGNSKKGSLCNQGSKGYGRDKLWHKTGTMKCTKWSARCLHSQTLSQESSADLSQRSACKFVKDRTAPRWVNYSQRLCPKLRCCDRIPRTPHPAK
jgi:hypothetical protein